MENPTADPINFGAQSVGIDFTYIPVLKFAISHISKIDG